MRLILSSFLPNNGKGRLLFDSPFVLTDPLLHFSPLFAESYLFVLLMNRDLWLLDFILGIHLRNPTLTIFTITAHTFAVNTITVCTLTGFFILLKFLLFRTTLTVITSTIGTFTIFA